MLSLKSIVVALLSTVTVVSAVDKTTNPKLVADLKSAATALDRQALLPNDKDWTFDFAKQEKWTYSPGSVVNANAATFPALATVDMTVAYLNLGPCAMLPPHYHPRATNLVVAIEGSTTTYMVEENSARVVQTTLTPGKMTIFPTASLHSMQNNLCTNSTLISTLNSADTGTNNYFNSVFQLPLDLVQAGLGGANVDLKKLSQSVPPVGTGSILGSAECRKRCGIA